MDDALVSVIVPVFQGEQLVGEALDSIAAQRYARLETIVVDDGSADASARVAARWPGVRVLRQPHSGVAAARNAGVAAARGDLLAFLDQDDIWEPTKLQRQVSVLESRSEVDIVLTHVERLLMAGTPRPHWFQVDWFTDPQPGYVPSTWLVRRDAFDRVGPFDPTFKLGCDSDWLARATDAGCTNVMLADALVRWRVHGRNGSYDQSTMQSEWVRVLRDSARRKRQAVGSG